jgi:hypothetical protein
MKHQASTSVRSLAKARLSFSTTVVIAAISISNTQAAITADFNNDGKDDFVVGDRNADIAGFNGAGHVAIITPDQNGEMRADIWNRQRLYSLGGPQPYGGFGEAVAVGDFNGDGHQDLAVGSPREGFPGTNDKPWSGAVSIVYGMAGGLNQSSHHQLRSTQVGAWNQFGYALAVGDFNGDGKDDLAVGAPGRALFNQENDFMADGPGAVAVYFGKTEGLVDRSEWYFDRSQSWVAGEAQAGARFGASLAAGDFNADGRDDLLMGAPNDDVRRSSGNVDVDAGSVTMKIGSALGFRPDAGILIHDYNESSNAGDQYGSSLVAGNFNGNAYDDFAIGHAGERVGSKRWAGAVTVHYGSRLAVDRGSFVRGELLYQSRSGIPGRSETGDNFGKVLAAADFDNDGRDDLAIGIPGEDIERTGFDRNNAGAVLVMYGTRVAGMVARGAQSDFHQDKSGVKGKAENNDSFGNELSVGDYDGNGIADLLIGVTGESVSGISDSRGVIQLLHGRSSIGLGPRADLEQIYHKGNIRSMGGRHFGTAMP